MENDFSLKEKIALDKLRTNNVFQQQLEKWRGSIRHKGEEKFRDEINQLVSCRDNEYLLSHPHAVKDTEMFKEMELMLRKITSSFLFLYALYIAFVLFPKKDVDISPTFARVVQIMMASCSVILAIETCPSIFTTRISSTSKLAMVIFCASTIVWTISMSILHSLTDSNSYFTLFQNTASYQRTIGFVITGGTWTFNKFMYLYSHLLYVSSCALSILIPVFAIYFSYQIFTW